jgi:murein L,D-transpeptidase YafK
VGILLVTCALIAWAQWPATPLPTTVHVDRVVVSKSTRTLSLLQGSTVIRSYPIALGRHLVGSKQKEGDNRTPEGLYQLDSVNLSSGFHRALHVSYPSPADSRSAHARGELPGGAIMVHGIKNGLGFLGRLHSLVNWTNGCIAVSNAQIEEIVRVVPVGTPIQINP